MEGTRSQATAGTTWPNGAIRAWNSPHLTYLSFIVDCLIGLENQSKFNDEDDDIPMTKVEAFRMTMRPYLAGAPAPALPSHLRLLSGTRRVVSAPFARFWTDK